MTTGKVWALRTAFRTVGTLAPGAAARWAETLFCSPPRHQPRSSDQAFLATGSRFTVRSEGQDLAGWEWGDGPAVLLMHGWGSRAGRLSAIAGALVQGGFRAVAFDAPAHGESTGRFASLPEFARGLRAVGDRVGPLRGVLGHSLGGAAISVALRDGLAAERVVLIAPPADARLFVHAFGRQLRLPRPVQDTMLRNLEARLRFRFAELHITAFAPQLRAAVLILHDRDDPDVPFSHGEAIAGAWPGARLVPTTGLGHRAILRDQAVIGESVRFLGEGLAG